MNEQTTVAALAALAQETRLRIFRLLVQAGHDGLVVGAIATATGTAPATLSFHLKSLAQAGLVVARNEGRFIRYSADYEAMTSLLRYLTENCCGGMGCETLVDAVDPACQCSPSETS